MLQKPSTVYAQLRSEFTGQNALHEAQDAPSEHLLQAIWQHQRLHRNRIKTVAGQPVFILHPGFLNREAGPDFQNAIIQIGQNRPQTGDVEVDSQPTDWVQHKHGSNPAYTNVVLHVVWHASPAAPSPANVPMIELAPYLEAPLAELSAWLYQEPASEPPSFVGGKCAAPLQDLRPGPLETLLDQAALFRLHARAEHIKARAREVGWNQTLWEGVFRALGYKHNGWPMQRLAELRQRWYKPGASTKEVLARLLGLGGLLPAEIGSPRSSASTYVRQLWDCWWRERDEFADCILPTKSWRLAGIRPANHPQRRLALASHWATGVDFADLLRAWCHSPQLDSHLPDSLLKLLQPKPDHFWSQHYTLQSRTTVRRIPMLGADRVTDLAANVILPWLWSRASQGRRTNTCREVEHRYLIWPAGSDNAVLKLARQRLLGHRKEKLPNRMSMQQGLLQVVRDYCDQSDSLCSRCRFPEVARRFSGP